MHEQYAFRVGSIDRKYADVIRGKTVGRIDPDGAMIQAVRYIEWLKFNRGPAIGWYFYFAGCNGVAIDNERDSFGCGRGSVARDHCLYPRFLRIFRVGKLSRCV